MEKIKVHLGLDETYLEGYKEFGHLIENLINKTGGIGGLNIEVNCLQMNDMLTNYQPTSDDIKKIIKILDNNSANILLDIPRIYAPKLSENFNGLIFSIMGHNSQAYGPKLFDMDRSLLSNPEFSAFVSKKLNPPKILFIQNSFFADENVYKVYEDSLKRENWKNSFETFSLPTDDESLIQEKNENNDVHIESKISEIKNALRAAIKGLPTNSLIISNVQYIEELCEIINEVKTELSLEHLCLHSPVNQEMIHKGVGSFDADMTKRLEEIRNQIKFYKHDLEAFHVAYLDFLPLFICQYAAKRNGYNFKSIAEAMESLPQAINDIDGVKDSFLHYGLESSFKNNSLISKTSFAIRRTFVDQLNSYQEIFYEIQPSSKQKSKKVLYVYIDLYRIDEVNISDGYWVAEFELEVNSPQKDPIQYIKFWNRFDLKDIWNVSVIKEDTDKDRFQTKYRIVGAFDLKPEIEDFPFDTQKLRMDMSIEKNVEDCIMQPPIKALIDKDFIINGWKPIDAFAGTVSEKNFDRVGKKLQTRVNISKINRTEWSVLRNNNIAVLRSLIPLLVMMILSWYSSFNDIAESASTIQLNTTVFLAGVALYFSAEKPKGARFTFIDRLFIYFYIAIGILILSEFSALINVELYNYLHLIWQVAIPGFVVVLLFQIWRQITRVRNTNL